ncbi:MAG: GMC family oxidoreductase N-terminal domain-containing protein, partial [Hylemonella sp.]|nr:GMC family oxidoreductase N-terminal domain-containing protein [Hylemonella sp.]
MSNTTFDYIIVGAGTAGCLLANRLSADPSKRVLLIEAGGKDNYHWIHIPVGYLYCIGNPRTDWLYQTEPDAGLNGRRLRYPRGRTLGGSSSINGMIYMRGQSRDYDLWAQQTGDDSWRWDQVLPYFKRHEDHYKGSGELHGAGGEWRIEKQRLRWELLDAFSEAAVEAGIPATDDFNRGNNEGVAYFEVNQKSGWRWNASKAFLRPVAHRSNLQVWTGMQVSRLLIEQQDGGSPVCRGVELWDGHQRVEVRAHSEVVLSAGSIGSVQILQLSGIGQGELLQRHGITVQHELPGVGANLQDHLQIRSVYKVEGVRTLNTLANSLWGKAAIGLEYLLKRSGPMSMSPSQLGAFTKTDPALAWPN